MVTCTICGLFNATFSQAELKIITKMHTKCKMQKKNVVPMFNFDHIFIYFNFGQIAPLSFFFHLWILSGLVFVLCHTFGAVFVPWLQKRKKNHTRYKVTAQHILFFSLLKQSIFIGAHFPCCGQKKKDSLSYVFNASMKKIIMHIVFWFTNLFFPVV